MQRNRRLQQRIGAVALGLFASFVSTSIPLAAQSHHFVYLSSSSQMIAGFELDPLTQSLTPIASQPINEGHNLAGLAFHPSGRFLYALNPNENSVSAFTVNSVTGALTEVPASPFAVVGDSSGTPKFMAVEPAGKFLYVVSAAGDAQTTTATVSDYSIDSAGALTADTTLSLGLFSPVGLVCKPDSHFLYLVGTLASNDVSIFSFEPDPVTGALDLNNVHLSTGQGGQFAKSVGLVPHGQFLFVGRGQSQGSIDTYALPADGIFDSPVNTLQMAGGSGLPLALAVDVSGAYLYAAVANLGIAGFSVGSSGALTSVPELPVAPSIVLLADPVTQFPYLYSQQRAFGVSGSGALNELSGSPLAVAGNITGIAAASPLDQTGTDPVAPISAPVISLSPSSLQFPDEFVGRSGSSRTVTLSNLGTAPLSLVGISTTGMNSSDFTLSHDCPALLSPNSGCTIALTFQPLFDGARQASLTVLDNAPGSPHGVALTGAARIPFTLGADHSAVSVTAGQMAQYTLQLAPASGFVGQVLLSCLVVPDQTTCDVPSSVDLNGVGSGAPALVSVTVPTKARTTLMSPARRSYPDTGQWPSLSLLFSATLLALFFLVLRSLSRSLTGAVTTRDKLHCATMVLLACACLGMVSCSGSTGSGASSSAQASQGPSPASSSPPASSPSSGTPTGQYTLTLTAKAGSAVQTISLSLSIQ